MNEMKSRSSLAVFLLVIGAGFTLSGQILWTRVSGSKVKDTQPERKESGSQPVTKTGEEGSGSRNSDSSEKKSLLQKKDTLGEKKEGVVGAKTRGLYENRKATDSTTRESKVRVTPLPPKTIILIMGNRSSRVSSSHKRRLRALAKGRIDGKWQFTITAYAGERSSQKKNGWLANSRGRHVAKVLRRFGVPQSSIITKRNVAGKNNRFHTSWRKVEVATKHKQETP